MKDCQCLWSQDMQKCRKSMDCFLRKLCIAWSELILLIWLQLQYSTALYEEKIPHISEAVFSTFMPWPLFWCNTWHIHSLKYQFSSVQFSSVAQSYLTLWPYRLQTLGFPVHYQLPELTQTRVHWVGDAIQPSHPLSSPSPPAPNLSQHQGPFQ